MGRSVTAYSQVIDQNLQRWQSFRQGLRKDDRQIFDKLMLIPKRQVQAGVMAQHLNPFDSMSMAIIIELQKQLEDCQQRIAELEKKNSSP